MHVADPPAASVEEDVGAYSNILVGMPSNTITRDVVIISLWYEGSYHPFFSSMPDALRGGGGDSMCWEEADGAFKSVIQGIVPLY